MGISQRDAGLGEGAADGRRRGPGRPQAGGQDTREHILSESLRLFSTAGFHGTSLAEIGRAAGVTKATVLHHFDSKEALFVEVLRRRDAGDGSRATTGGGSSIPTPREFLDGWARLVTHNETTPELVALYASMSVGALDAAHPAHSWIREHWETTVAGIVRVLEQGKVAGLVREGAPSERLARLIVAAADGLQLQWLGARADAPAGAETLHADALASVSPAGAETLHADSLASVSPAGAETLHADSLASGSPAGAETLHADAPAPVLLTGATMVAETRELLELIAARWLLD